MRRARIFGVINAVAEAGNLLLLRQHAFDVLDRIGATLCQSPPEYGTPLRWLRRAAGPLSAPMAGSDRRVHVRQRGGGHARRKGRGVQFVVGMQDQRDVQRPLGSLRRRLAVQHQQEIRRRATGCGPAPLRLFPCGCGHRPPRSSRSARSGGWPCARWRRDRCSVFRIVERQRGNRRAQHVHGQRVFRALPQQVKDRRIEFALFRQPLA